MDGLKLLLYVLVVVAGILIVLLPVSIVKNFRARKNNAPLREPSLFHRLLFGILRGGLVGGAAAGIAGSLAFIVNDATPLSVTLPTALFGIALSMGFAIPVTALAALPVYALFERLKWRRLHHYLLAGALFVPVTAQLYQIIAGNENNLLSLRYLEGWALLASGGIPAAWAFWCHCVRHPETAAFHENVTETG